jgi:hypothetical protein
MTGFHSVAWSQRSAQQIIAEVGATAATFPSQKHLSSWVGACPGDEESAEVNYSRRSPQGNRHMRRILNQAANAAAKHKGSIFEILYRRYVPRLGHNQTIGIIAHKLCRLIWKILQSVQAKAHPKNDPSTPQAWLPNRTEPFSITHHSMIAISEWRDFRPCVRFRTSLAHSSSMWLSRWCWINRPVRGNPKV